MKTAEEKANELVDKYVENGLDCGIGMHRTMVRMIETAIKEQDRDTRMACAEAIDEVNSTDMPSDACWKEDACEACMNVKAC